MKLYWYYRAGLGEEYKSLSQGRAVTVALGYGIKADEITSGASLIRDGRAPCCFISDNHGGSLFVSREPITEAIILARDPACIPQTASPPVNAAQEDAPASP